MKPQNSVLALILQFVGALNSPICHIQHDLPLIGPPKHLSWQHMLQSKWNKLKTDMKSSDSKRNLVEWCLVGTSKHIILHLGTYQK